MSIKTRGNVFCYGCKFRKLDRWGEDECKAASPRVFSAVHKVIAYQRCSVVNQWNDCTMRQPGFWEITWNTVKELLGVSDATI